MPKDDLPLLTFPDTPSLERWLDEQGGASPTNKEQRRKERTVRAAGC